MNCFYNRIQLQISSLFVLNVLKLLDISLVAFNKLRTIINYFKTFHVFLCV